MVSRSVRSFTISFMTKLHTAAICGRSCGDELCQILIRDREAGKVRPRLPDGVIYRDRFVSARVDENGNPFI